VEALLAFAASLVALRLAGALVRRWRATSRPELAAWAASLLSYSAACAALAWGAAAGWDGRVFRVYYLFGGLLSAPLLGLGSLLLVRARFTRVIGWLYAGFAIGVAVAVPITRPMEGSGIPAAQRHLDLLPARLLAIVGNSLGTLAVVGVALLTIRRRPLANGLILAGVAVAATGSAQTGLGEGGTAGLLAAAAILLYAGFVAPRSLRSAQSLLTLRSRYRLIR